MNNNTLLAKQLDLVVSELEDLNRLRAYIRKTVGQQFDDICWLDVYRDLAQMVGMVFNPMLLPRDQFVRQCGMFYDSMVTGTEYPLCLVTERIKQLERAIEEINQTLRVPAAEYVPAIGDVFIIIDQLKHKPPRSRADDSQVQND